LKLDQYEHRTHGDEVQTLQTYWFAVMLHKHSVEEPNYTEITRLIWHSENDESTFPFIHK
jgi:hypothetical protein